MLRLLIIPTIVLSLVAAGLSARAADIRGSLSIGTGYLDNPLGVSNDTPAGYLLQALSLSSAFGQTGGEGGVFKLGYEGSASQFGPHQYLHNILSKPLESS